jgi:hypothetical protein
VRIALKHERRAGLHTTGDILAAFERDAGDLGVELACIADREVAIAFEEVVFACEEVVDE